MLSSNVLWIIYKNVINYDAREYLTTSTKEEEEEDDESIVWLWL